jgi:hypothetical protein
MSLPSSKEDVIAAVRALTSRLPKTGDELAILQGECLDLALHIQKRLVLEVPEPVWHFLSDADIRFKSSEYARVQLAEVSAALAAWEFVVPSNISLQRDRVR